MPSFEILCVTMHQNDFSKIKEMNIHSDVVFANQADDTRFDAINFENHTAKMITTATRGVGINRNLSLMYASADICLLADDDMVFDDNVEDIICSEFKAHPDADVIIFNYTTDDPERQPRVYNKTKKHRKWQRMTWGAVRVAFRLSSIQKSGNFFTTLFGGGCKYLAGEDSMWLYKARKSGLVFYVSDKFIGKVSFETSSWYTGMNEKLYFSKGAYVKATHPKTALIWNFYYSLRNGSRSKLNFAERYKWMLRGNASYDKLISYDEYISINKK